MSTVSKEMSRVVAAIVGVFFTTNMVFMPVSYAQGTVLPPVGSMVPMTAKFNPLLVKGVKFAQDNPFKFEFIADTGDHVLTQDQIKNEGQEFASYFLAALTTPEKEMWVNLSPYEKDRIIPQAFGDTDMGKELLAQDYILKQLMATALYPERDLGREFWNKVYEQANKQFGTTKVAINTFNKVWIVPNEAVVYENPQMNAVFVVKSSLKVMLEQDYLAANKNQVLDQFSAGAVPNKDAQALDSLSSQIIKQIVIPALEKEVNEGRNFAKLRQVYQALILAAWYKKNLRDSVLAKAYVDQGKTRGVDAQDKDMNQKIYEQYLKAYKTGAYNYIKEEIDPATKQIVPRKYFSGGVDSRAMTARLTVASPALAAQAAQDFAMRSRAGFFVSISALAILMTGLAGGAQAANNPVEITNQGPFKAFQVLSPGGSIQDYNRQVANGELQVEYRGTTKKLSEYNPNRIPGGAKLTMVTVELPPAPAAEPIRPAPRVNVPGQVSGEKALLAEAGQVKGSVPAHVIVRTPLPETAVTVFDVFKNIAAYGGNSFSIRANDPGAQAYIQDIFGPSQNVTAVADGNTQIYTFQYPAAFFADMVNRSNPKTNAILANPKLAQVGAAIVLPSANKSGQVLVMQAATGQTRPAGATTPSPLQQGATVDAVSVAGVPSIIAQNLVSIGGGRVAFKVPAGLDMDWNGKWWNGEDSIWWKLADLYEAGDGAYGAWKMSIKDTFYHEYKNARPGQLINLPNVINVDGRGFIPYPATLTAKISNAKWPVFVQTPVAPVVKQSADAVSQPVAPVERGPFVLRTDGTHNWRSVELTYRSLRARINAEMKDRAKGYQMVKALDAAYSTAFNARPYINANPLNMPMAEYLRKTNAIGEPAYQAWVQALRPIVNAFNHDNGSRNSAMIGEEGLSPEGGIDFAQINLMIKNGNSGIKTAFTDPRVLEALRQAPGLFGEVVEIKTMTAPMVNMYLGMHAQMPTPVKNAGRHNSNEILKSAWVNKEQLSEILA